MASVETGVTEIRIGATDGYRYIGIKPPLTDDEIAELKEVDVLKGGIQQVELEPACTLVSTSGDFTTPKGHTEGTVRRAEQIAIFLGHLRSEANIKVFSDPVQMSGYQSSPFNPVTR